MTVGPGTARHVWLVGMPGSGKSAVGRLLAERLGLAFVDLDDEVERTAGMTVAEIFAHGGEPSFRHLESQALRAAAEGPPSVVATGGGAVIADENRRLMRRTGRVVHLDIDVDEAWARLSADATLRPLVPDRDEWLRLADERAPLYRDASDSWAEAGAEGTPEQLATLLARPAAEWSAPPDTVRVDSVDGGYDVVVGMGVLVRLRHLLPAAPAEGTAFIIADREVSREFLSAVAKSGEDAGWRAVHLAVPQGEEAKSLAVAEALYEQLSVHEAQRDDLVVALGGGATGDLAGFVAATYLRGMRLVQVPTTLLAQVDSAIGGKTGVNLPAGKNLVGVFHQPVLVAADIFATKTLPDRDYRSGLGEVAKYALAFDRGLVDVLEREAARVLRRDFLDRATWKVLHDVVVACVRIKAEIVSKDERDAGDRLFLNYGHTLGHALERIDEFLGRSHGEAVAIGMVFAARLAERLGVAAPGLVDRHVELLDLLGLPTRGPLPPASEILEAMRMDKKRQGALRFVLLEDVGRPMIATDVPDDVVIETLEKM